VAPVPSHIVDRIRSEANIVDVVSDYVRLRRTGKNWLGLCPFHEDRKPSLNVEPIKGIYKCFACGKGGNVFTFLMEINGWSFPEAVRHLARGMGIEIPDGDGDREAMAEGERILGAVADACSWFRSVYASARGESARSYFRHRGLGDEVIDRFQLGYAPDEWEGLLTHLTGRGYTPEELEKAGLAIRREGRSGWYDRFRGRTLFPVFSATGRVVGFGARRMSEDPDQPKYINSPETPIYHKSRLLYGLYHAKETIRRSGIALLVEGYLDVISLHQGGITNAIATCGTSLASEHADLLSRYTNRIVLVFDSDRAGESATDRGIDVLLGRGLDVSVLRLPDGEDPDTFVTKFGAKEMERRLSDSVSFLEFRARALKGSGAFDAPDRQAEAIRSIVASIALVPDALKRELYCQKIASDYFLPESLMARELERALGRERDAGRRHTTQRKPPDPQPRPSEQSEPSDSRVEPGPIDPDELPSAELALLQVLLAGDPLMLEHVFARITQDDFVHPVTRGLLQVVHAHYDNQRSFSMDELMMEDLAPETRELATLLAIDRETISSHWIRIDPTLSDPNPWRVARDCLVRIEQAGIDREIRAIQENLGRAGLTEEDERHMLERFRALRSKAEDLKHLISG